MPKKTTHARPTILLPKPQVMKMTTFGTCKPRMAKVDSEQETERRNQVLHTYHKKSGGVKWGGDVGCDPPGSCKPMMADTLVELDVGWLRC